MVKKGREICTSPLRGSKSSLLRLVNTFSYGSSCRLDKMGTNVEGEAAGKMLGTEALSFLRTEMIRVNTPPLRDLEVDGKKRGFFFDIGRPPAEVSEGEWLLREKRRKNSTNLKVLTGPVTASSKIVLPQKPDLMPIRTNSSQNTVKVKPSVPNSRQDSTGRSMSMETPDYFRQRIATLVDTPDMESNEVLAMEVPEHLPSSPLCPLHPKYSGRRGGKMLCPMHGKGKKVMTRQAGVGRSMLDGI